ncbi:MAG: DUF4097 family beta strand repeat-containing protein [Mucilaginibacter sp.]
MKTIKFTVLMLAALMLSGRLMAQTESKDQQLVVPLSEPGKPYKLNVGLTSGSIKISTYEGKDVVVDVSVAEHRKTVRENGSGMHRIAGGESLDITAHEKNNEVTISSGMPQRAVMLTIKVPQGASNVKLNTVNGGNIVANDLTGALEVTNVNGFINLFNISGSVVANTVNGKVLVTFKSIDPKAAMAFSTLNGNVDVTFPAGLKANLKIKTDQGQVFSDFDMTTDASQPKATKTAKDGMYRITIEDWIYGKIDGGGPEIMMKNMNGNIYIRKAK